MDPVDRAFLRLRACWWVLLPESAWKHLVGMASNLAQMSADSEGEI